MNTISFTQKIFIQIAGYDLETAKSCTSSEINKMAKHGTLILIPAIVGLFSMSYAMFLISKSLLISVIGGTIWGIVIFFIDRSLVSGNKPGTFNLGMLGRLLFTVIIGFVVAEPVVLLAFKDTINEKIHEEFIVKKDELNKKYSPRIVSLNKGLKTARERLDKKQKSYTSEMDGTGGSGNPNKGPIYKQKYDDYQNELTNYNEFKDEISDLKSGLNTEFNNELNELKTVQANGLLGQFRALHSLKDKEVVYATWALRLFFFFIEIIPFLIKISPNKKGDLYYDIVDDENKVQLSIVTSNNTLKKELMESEEKSRNKEKILKLNEIDTKKIAASNELNTEHIAKQMYLAADKKLKQDLKAIKNIKDEEIKAKLLSQLNQVYDGYFKNMEDLIIKSNQFYSNNI
ncbi:DUF4407 domain-containing protein [Lutibacter sp. TH_r2]|uniref:DUF4407 domain-containing protein n=1 Tax=Lutibacter sp. TH_r2 TaxID=3082083 RepID=UPI0029534133|nr:DUF4407 domain-containing protein [Lutibacter sp. TH_r2]MDV7186099.1 DUF4407 domain-containing protein [Lutibacter sp. TH_r2]